MMQASEIRRDLRELWSDDRGATAVEYALIVAGVASVIVAIVLALGGKVQTTFTTFNSAMPGSGGG